MIVYIKTYNIHVSAFSASFTQVSHGNTQIKGIET